MIPVVLVGAAGRMGRAVADALAGASDLTLRACVDPSANRAGDGGVWHGDVGEATRAGDVVVEFSSPAGCAAAARACRERGAALVSGTTGLGPDEEAALSAAAARVAVLRASNFSLGLAALRRSLAAALEALPETWDVEIVERHHRRKADSPSGTALSLAREAAARRGWEESAFRFGRHGRVGERPAREIGVHAVRGGSWVGDHAVLLAGEGEWLELRHIAQDRGAFAHGVLAAIRFVSGTRPGMYNLDDVLHSKGREKT